MEIVSFTLEGHRYGLPLRDVQEVVRAAALSPLPGAPDVVEGLLNLRGVLVPVYDLRRRFGFPARPLDPDHRFIVAQGPRGPVAMRVDDTGWILSIQPSDLEPFTELRSQAPYVIGAARLPDGVIVLHDLRAFLSQAERTLLDTALRDHSPAEERA